MGVVVTVKSKTVASSAWHYLEILDQFYLTYLKAQTNCPSRYLTAQPHHNTGQHYCHLNFPLPGNTAPYWIRSGSAVQVCLKKRSRGTFVPKLIFSLFCTNLGSINKNPMGFKFSHPVFSCFWLLNDLIYANLRKPLHRSMKQSFLG